MPAVAAAAAEIIPNLQQNYSCYITLSKAITWTQAVIPRSWQQRAEFKSTRLALHTLFRQDRREASKSLQKICLENTFGNSI